MPEVHPPTYEKIAMAIGRRVKLIRKHLKLTQRELAKRLSISVGYLSDVENGKNKINIDIVSGIVLHFPEISPGWLLVGRGDMIIREQEILSENYSLDIYALQAAEEIFSREVRHTHDAKARGHLFNVQLQYLNLIYRVYMTHLHALRAQGVPEAEARKLARSECDRLDTREVGVGFL
jgi:transcriptional regulator with XRE-family HTH domain